MRFNHQILYHSNIFRCFFFEDADFSGGLRELCGRVRRTFRQRQRTTDVGCGGDRTARWQRCFEAWFHGGLGVGNGIFWMFP